MEVNEVNKVTVLAGGRGTGKTDWLKDRIRATKQARPDLSVLVVDTFDNPRWRNMDTHQYKGTPSIPIIPVDKLGRWKGGTIARTADSDIPKQLAVIESKLMNCLLILEDATRYIGNGRLSDSQRKFVLDSKQKNIDIIFVFHLFKKIPDDLLGFSDVLTMFKTSDKLHTRIMQDRYVDTYDFFEQAFNIIRNSPNKYIHQSFYIGN